MSGRTTSHKKSNSGVVRGNIAGMMTRWILECWCVHCSIASTTWAGFSKWQLISARRNLIKVSEKAPSNDSRPEMVMNVADRAQDTLIFRQQTPPPPPCSWISMSFDRADLMHVFNAPPELNQSFLDAIGLRVQRSQYLQPKVFEIKFRGYPWTASGTDTVQQRVFMLNFMECLEQHGFTLYTSMTQDDGPGGDNHSSGADTWYCNRPQDWSPGVPIYHWIMMNSIEFKCLRLHDIKVAPERQYWPLHRMMSVDTLYPASWSWWGINATVISFPGLAMF